MSHMEMVACNIFGMAGRNCNWTNAQNNKSKRASINEIYTFFVLIFMHGGFGVRVDVRSVELWPPNSHSICRFRFEYIIFDTWLMGSCIHMLFPIHFRYNIHRRSVMCTYAVCFIKCMYFSNSTQSAPVFRHVLPLVSISVECCATAAVTSFFCNIIANPI